LGSDWGLINLYLQGSTPFVKGELRLLQVCADTTDKETRERETSALAQAEAELKTKGMLVTPENYLSFLSSL
jgi:hypothetical protein